MLSCLPVERLTESITVRVLDADAFGLLTPVALAGYLSEVAGRHAQALDAGMDLLASRGQAWVLARSRMEIAGEARAGDLLEVETWPSGASRLWALRDFRVRSGRGEVARAITAWLVIDLATRRPVRPDKVLDPRLHPEREHALPPPEEKLPPLEAAAWERRFSIRWLDIDRNRHATNTAYLGWALEAVPEETWGGGRVTGLEVHYLAECTYGSKVLSRAAPGAPGELRHAVVREEDGKELARLSTRWAPR